MNTLLISLLWATLAVAQEPTPSPPESGETTDTDGDAPAEALPLIEGPSILEYVEAPYPEAAKSGGIEGKVILLIELDDTGAVIDVQVTEEAGFGFDEAAVAAVHQMSFAPAQTEAGPVGVVFEFAYGFILEPEPEENLPLPINLQGDIRRLATRAPVDKATVTIVGTDITGSTDEVGAFALRGVPAGVHTVRVIHPEFTTLQTTLEVVEGEATNARLWMRALSYRENEAVAVYQRRREEVTRRTLTIDEVRRIPGTFGDPVRVVQTLPGAARSPFGTGFLIIRGANPTDSAVYVDGIRIPLIYHLTGTTSVLSPEIIESVDYLPGGYGVHYGRSMGGVIDVKTKTDFGQPKLSFGTDILDAQLYFEGQLGKNDQHGFAAGVRRSYIDAFIPLFTAGTGFVLKPVYWDYQAKWVPKLPGNRKFSTFIYGFNDILEVSTPGDQAQGFDQDTQGDFRTEYQSHRVIFQYKEDFNDKLSLDVQPSFGLDTSSLGLGQEFNLGVETWVFQLRARLPWRPHPVFELEPGVDLLAGYWKFDFASAFQFSDLDDPLAERQSVGFGGTGWGFTPDVYLDAHIRPLNGSDRWLITPGIRGNFQIITYEGDVSDDGTVPPFAIYSADPRIATRVELFKGGVLKGSTGFYHQAPQPFESVGLGEAVPLNYERSWNSSIGFEHQVIAGLTWDIDLFYRDMTSLVVFNEEWTGFGDHPFINGGQGRAYGLELMVRAKDIGPFYGWVSYTLSKSERKDSEDGDWYPFDFDQTHIFVANAGLNLPYDIGVSGQVQYVTGNPFTPYNAGVFDVDGNFYNEFAIGGENQERMPPFFQASLRVDKLWTFKFWQLETYIDLMNVVRGINPEIAVYSYDASEFAYVRGLPFIPNLGLEAKFFL